LLHTLLCPRRGRRDKSRLILFIWGTLFGAGTFGFFQLRPLDGARGFVPRRPKAWLKLDKKCKTGVGGGEKYGGEKQ